MKLTTDIFIERAKAIHGNKYDYSEVVYKNIKTKVSIICSKHGVFEQTPDKHLHGRCGCPKCVGNIINDITDFVKKAKLVHGSKYDYSLVNYKNNKTPVEIVCSEHGIFLQKPDNHLQGKGCPYCAGNIKLSKNEFVKRAQQVHGDVYDYTDVDYQSNKIPVIINCRIHGKFEQVPYVHLSGCGCPLCGKTKRILNRDTKLIREKAVNTFLKRYGVINPMYDVEIRNKHKRIVSSNIVNKKRISTKRQNQSFNSSSSEHKLSILLKSVFGDDDVFDNFVSDVYPFKCDYYIKSRDMYIELNAHWSHGGHWYNALYDKAIIDEWSQKSKFYQNAAETFSVRDVKKRNIAQQNKLNYVVFWKTDLSDALQWFAVGCPDGQDWDKEYSWL